MAKTPKPPRQERWSSRGVVSNFGRSYRWINCPFCGVSTKAFLWSFAGHGFKRCDGCGARHGYGGYTTQVTPQKA